MMAKNTGRKTRRKNSKDPNEAITKRLDALIRVVLETLYDKKDRKFNETSAVKILNSAGLTPTEIARILGKKDRRAVSPMLYSKGKKKKAEKPESEEGAQEE